MSETLKHSVLEGGFQISVYSNTMQGCEPQHDASEMTGHWPPEAEDIAFSFFPKELQTS